MKIFWRILIVLAIAIPIFVCWRTLQTVWDEPEDNVSSGDSEKTNPVNGQEVVEFLDSGEEKVIKDDFVEGAEIDITGMTAESKIYTDAEVKISLANVYSLADETSEVVCKLEKGTFITAQKYNDGWSLVTNYKSYGWMRTENIQFPSDDGGNMTLNNPTSGDVKKGTVTVDDALNVRESASTTAKVITTLTNGTVVTITETKDGWYKIKYNGTIGWVSSDYVTVK